MGKIMKYNALYGNGSFKEVELGEQIHKGGASGKIFLAKNLPNKVIKIFHHLENSASNRKKLESMLLNPPLIPPLVKDGVEYIQIAWPEAIVEDEKGFCVGYLMPLINMKEAVSLDHLMQKAVRKKLNLPEKYAYRVFAAYNVASMITALHKQGHFVIDLKPSNISVYKENMMVAVVDCDGFSIAGENCRYPAEFVSEEYIYPEGLEQSCDQMNVEQDKFALAVLIFRLLNNGIHPFAGTPNKADEKALTIQTRIEKYHYAYGLWPDSYQSPHPYSIHNYFDKKTLEMFDLSFGKNTTRPTAFDWQEHLWKLLNILKPCKKNPDHLYWTAKGCGLCAIDDKFFDNMAEIKKKQASQVLVRGMETSSLKNEEIEKQKKVQKIHNKKVQNIFIAIIAVYMLFFAFLYPILSPWTAQILTIGLGVQFIASTLLLLGINFLINKYKVRYYFLENPALSNMLQIYALICLIICIILINNLSIKIFSLA